jgi:hypothetical protein
VTFALHRTDADGDHRDFDDRQVGDFASWLVAEFGARPPTGSDAILVAQEGAPERFTRAGLVAWLTASCLGSVARRVERFAVPRGFAVFVIVGDEGVRVRGLRVDDLAMAADEETTPRGFSALGVLGALGGAR